jgi:hypothetical protein
MFSEEEYLIPGRIEVQQQVVPDVTEWEHKCSCMCFDFNEIKTNGDLYCNEWKISLCPTLYVVTLITSSLLIYLFVISPTLSFRTIALDIIMISTNLLFILSYIVAILEGPGFLPYFYPMQITKRTDGLVDYLSGVVSNEAQENFVKKQPKLKRCRYFATAKRYVLRPDHFCGWTSQFMGKKNYKLFILFNLWGAVYVTMFTVLSFFALPKVFTLETNIFGGIVIIIYLMQSILFTFMTWGFGCTGLYNAHMNTTQFEQMSNAPVKRREKCIENWEEIFGSHKKWYLWPLPIPAFHGIPSEYLLTHNI